MGIFGTLLQGNTLKRVEATLHQKTGVIKNRNRYSIDAPLETLVAHLSFSLAIAEEEYSGRNRVLAQVEAWGRLSFSPPALATVKGAGGLLRPVTKRRNRLRSSEVN